VTKTSKSRVCKVSFSKVLSGQFSLHSAVGQRCASVPARGCWVGTPRRQHVSYLVSESGMKYSSSF